MEQMNDSYMSFATVYDEFMDNVPYDEWVEYLSGLLKEYGVNDGIILDMGCGTGSVTRRLAKRGYDMIGIDNSSSMLQVAMEYKQQAVEENSEKEAGILYLLQDMREFELYGTVDAVVSICDSMNYITDKDDLCQVFRLVNNYLEKDGLFIFDLNTEYKYKNILGESTIAENRDRCSFIWENYYDEKEHINEYDLTIFINEDEEEEDIFTRYTETHRQRAYSLDEIKEQLSVAGMVFVAAYDAFTKSPVREDSERIYVIAKEGFQEGKKYNE